MTKIFFVVRNYSAQFQSNSEELINTPESLSITGVENNMNIKTSIRNLMCLGATLLGATAQADVVNIDLNDGIAENLYTGLAAASDPAGTAAIFNDVISNTSTGLVDSFGNATSVGVNLGGGNIFNNRVDQELAADPNGDGSTIANLLGDYAGLRDDNGGEIRTGNINGLVAGNAYDIYLYGQGDNFGGGINGGQNTGFRIGTDVRHTSHDGVNGGDGNLVEDIEYVLFSGIVADATGTIVLDYFAPGVGTNGTDPSLVDSDTGSADVDGNVSRFAALNAIQIVGDLTAVPEPSSFAVILGLGFAGLARRKRS